MSLNVNSLRRLKG